MAANCTDAQRLIAMSLGKIAVSRSQRGGANLHRSLLVSHVLHKARTAFMMENFQAMLHARQQQQQQFPQVEEPDTVQQPQEPEQDQVVPEMSPPPTPAPGQPSFPNPALRETQPQPGDTRPVSVQAEDDNEENDKENSPPSPNPSSRLEDNSNGKKEDKDKEGSCAKCTVKRRLATPSQDNAPERDSEPPSCKRAKSDSQPNPGVTPPPSSPSSPADKCEPEPMQTEAVQISNLVHRFNSGLSGLLSCSNSQNCDNNSSCATQLTVADSVPRFQDSLSRPVIALTV